MQTFATIRAVAVALVVAICPALSAADLKPVECEGTYSQHLQGVTTDEQSIFWCFTDQLVKTDLEGKIQKQVAVRTHHGDPCYHDGKVYVGVNFGLFNRSDGHADSWVYAYQADDLSLVSKHAVPEVFHGAGGIAYHDGKFIVVGGLPLFVEENYAYEYDDQFKFARRHVLKSGSTLMGIQTAEFADGHWWFGCYGFPPILLKTDEAFQNVERFEFDCTLGIVPLSAGRFLVGRRGRSAGDGYSGRLVAAVADPKRGLVLEKEESPKK
jgi:hypothetical protein